MSTLVKGLNLKLNLDIGDFDSKFGKLKTEAKNLEVTLKGLNRNLKFDSNDIDNLNRKMSTLEDLSSDATSKMSVLEQEMQDTANAMSRLEQEMSDPGFAESGKEAEKKTQQLNELKLKMRELIAEQVKAENQEKSAQAQLKQTQRALDNLDYNKARSDLKIYSEGVKGLQKEQKTWQAVLRATPGNINATSKSLNNYNKQIDLVKQEIDALKTVTEKLNKEGKLTLEADRQTQRDIEELELSLIQIEAQAKKVSQQKVRLQIESQQLYQAGIRAQTTGNQISNMGKSMTNVGQQMRGLSLVATGLTAVTVNLFAGFEQKMLRVQAITGSTGETFEELTAFAKEMGRTTRYTAEEAASGLEMLALAGFSAEDSMALLPKTLDFAIAGNIDLAEATDLVIAGMNKWGFEIENVDKLLDIYTKSGNSANMTIQQFAEANERVAGTAKVAGFSIEETNVALGTLGNNGIKGAEAGIRLRNVYLSLVAPTDKARKAFEEAGASQQEIAEYGGQLSEVLTDIGVNAFDASGNVRPLTDILTDLNEKVVAMSDKDKADFMNTIANKRDIEGFVVLMENMGASLDSADPKVRKMAEESLMLSEAINNSDGAMKTFLTTVNQGTALDLLKAKSALQDIAITLGEVFAPRIREVVEKLQVLATKFADLPAPVKNFAGQLLLTTALMPPLLQYFGVLGRTAGSAISTLGGAVQYMSASTKASGTALASATSNLTLAQKGIGKAGLTIKNTAISIANSFKALSTATKVSFGIIGVLVIALVVIFMKFKDEILAGLLPIWEQLKTAFLGFYQTVQPAISALGSAFGALFGGISSDAESGMGSAEESTSGFINVINVVIGFIGKLATGISTILGILAPIVADFFYKFADVVNAVMPTIQGIIETFLGFLPSITNVLGQVFTTVGNIFMTVLPVIMSLFEALMPVITSVLDMIISNMQMLLPYIEPIFQALSESMDQIMPALEELANVFVTQLMPAIMGLFDALMPMIPLVMDAVMSVIDALIPIFPIIIDAIMTIVSTIVSLLPVIIPIIMQIVDIVVKQILPLIISLIPIVMTAITSIISAIMPLVQLFISVVLPIILQIIVVVLKVIAKILPPIIAIVTVIVKVIVIVIQIITVVIVIIIKIITVIISVVAQIIVVITTVVQFIVNIITFVISVIVTIITTIVNIAVAIFEFIANVVSAIIEFVANIISTITEFVKSIVDKFIELKDAVVEKISSLITSIVEFFKSLPGKLTGALGKVTSKVVTTFKELPGKVKEQMSEFVSAGKDIIGGFVKGIKDNAKKIKDALLGVFKKAVDGVKNFLGINSPSKLFIQYGQWTMEGYEEGIDNMASAVDKVMLGTVTHAVAGVDDYTKQGANTFIQPQQTSTSNTNNNKSVTNNVTINITQQEGQSAEDLVEAINIALGKELI